MGPGRPHHCRYLVSQSARGHPGRQGPRLSSCPDWHEDDTCNLEHRSAQENRASGSEKTTNRLVGIEGDNSRQNRKRSGRGDPSLSDGMPTDDARFEHEDRRQRRRHDRHNAEEEPTLRQNNLPAERTTGNTGSDQCPTPAPRRHQTRINASLKSNQAAGETAEGDQNHEALSGHKPDMLLLAASHLGACQENDSIGISSDFFLQRNEQSKPDMLLPDIDNPSGTSPDLLPTIGENPEPTQASSTPQGNEQSLQRFSAPASGEYHAPKRRCMFKTSEKQLVRENNIRVAFHTPSNIPSPSSVTPSKVKAPATITRPELVTTSKYAAYHQQMGHTPPNLIAVSSRQKNVSLKTAICQPWSSKTNVSLLLLTCQYNKKTEERVKKTTTNMKLFSVFCPMLSLCLWSPVVLLCLCAVSCPSVFCPLLSLCLWSPVVLFCVCPSLLREYYSLVHAAICHVALPCVPIVSRT